jgi:hypothetical protein
MSQFQGFDASNSTVRAGVAGVVLLGGAMVVASIIGLNGCSKEKANVSQPSPVSSVNSQPVAATQPTAPVTPPAEVKKPARKRPAPVVTYNNKEYGVSFRYPRKYTLVSGEKKGEEGTAPIPMNFVQPGGVDVATVEMPAKLYPGTDFTSAFFNVSVNRSLTASECGQFATPDKQEGSTSEAESLGESKVLNFASTETGGAKYYHVFDTGACYEFGMAVATDPNPAENIKSVDRDEVFSKLDKILASVKIKPVAEEMTTGAKAEPPAAVSH